MKLVHVLNINNFFPELCEITMPLIEQYTKRIGAQLNIITERKFEEFPITYEKMQVFEYGRYADWNILLDADLLVHPEAPDLTAITDDTVVFQSMFDAHTMFEMDEYFLRDGRDVGVAAGMVVSSRMCHDLWTPLEMPYHIAKQKTKRQHILDEYCLSRNLARFGLKFLGAGNLDKFIHIGTATNDNGLPDEETPEQKVLRAKRLIKSFYP